MKATELDKKFDDGEEDILCHFDLTRVRLPNQPQQRLTVDLPTPLVRSLDQMADRLGITTPALIQSCLEQQVMDSTSQHETGQTGSPQGKAQRLAGQSG